jgi:hypothetical protein
MSAWTPRRKSRGMMSPIVRFVSTQVSHTHQGHPTVADRVTPGTGVLLTFLDALSPGKIPSLRL